MKLTLERTITYKAFKYCLKTLTKKNAPTTVSHGERSWGKGGVEGT
jgi:hypothetical protein